MDFLHYQMYDSNIFPHHHNSSPSTHNGYPLYNDLQLRAAQYPQPTMIMDNHHSGDKNETKPRLAKQEVELLERHFQENHKPPSALKRQLADQMGVDVARINNWFQNRRAKAKQESKQLDFDRLNNASQSYSEPSSPDHISASTGFEETSFTGSPHQMLPFSMSASLPTPPVPCHGLPAPPVPSCNPQYEDPTAASLSSLQRTIFEAEAAHKRGEYPSDMPEPSMNSHFGGPLYHDLPASDRAQFPVPSETSTTSFDFDESSFSPSTFSMESLDSHPMAITGSSAQEYEAFGSMSLPTQGTSDSSMVAFPSQLLSQGQPGFGASYQPSAFVPMKVENTEYSSEDTAMRFKSPPPPTDIAARRSKPRPTPIGTEALRDHTSMGPRTVSHTNALRRPNKSPKNEMRRVASVGANLNVLGSRVQKSAALPMRSPMQRHFSYEAAKFRDLNAQMVNQVPMSASLPLHNIRAPPTPNSPMERALMQQDSDNTSPSVSSSDADAEPESYLYSNTVPGCFTAQGMGMAIASPPETPHHPFGHWGYDASDEMIHTPSFGCFPGDVQLHMPQPQYVIPANVSQPATPAFGYFSGFSYTHASPPFDVHNVDHSVAEYRFPDSSGQYPLGSSVQSSPEQPKQKFTFHNATIDDYASKQQSSSPTM